MSARLVCPRCGHASRRLGDRFCDECGMPMVPDADAPVLSPEQERARQIDPAYAKGDLVKVAYAGNQPEAEMISGLLLEAGIPSVVKRARGFDVPDFLAAGPRDVLVARSGVEAAREALGEHLRPEATFSNSLRGVALAMLVIAAASVLIAVAAAALL